ncbi:hypothetical protein METH_11085 [Leisingera methylohalidivorans DSM 14336]|uniref:Uncharacterized protein n=1 Tax=Leisingera methylohalidivorans DSM 14336 TaxID=999552 RepID=V9W0A8_9RHOB|nr:hypothetical protein METH_11085 [Leisingera methylohalidivorans DSM 14336]
MGADPAGLKRFLHDPLRPIRSPAAACPGPGGQLLAVTASCSAA